MKRRAVYLTDGRDSRFARFYERLFRQQQDCDIIFHSQDGQKSLKAHLPVLTEYSTFFANKSLQSDRRPINMYLPSIKFSYIECILRVIYFKQESVPVEQVEKLKTVAQLLGVDIYFDPPSYFENIHGWPVGNQQSSSLLEPYDNDDYDDEVIEDRKACENRKENGVKKISELRKDMEDWKVSEDRSEDPSSKNSSESKMEALRRITHSVSASKEKKEVERQRNVDMQSLIAACNSDRYCFHCHRLYSSRQTLKRHKKTMHADQLNEKCSMCDFVGIPETLEQHFVDEHKLIISISTGGKRKRVGRNTSNNPTGGRKRKQRRLEADL